MIHTFMLREKYKHHFIVVTATKRGPSQCLRNNLLNGVNMVQRGFDWCIVKIVEAIPLVN